MSISKDNEVQVSRELTFGKKGMLYFEVPSYPTLKKIFDEIALRDKHSFPLKAAQ